MRLTPWFALGMAALLGCGEDLEIPRPRTRTDDKPVLLWVGPTPDFPICPGGRLDYWDGWAEPSTDPQYRNECGACTCGPAACALPDRMLVHEAPFCAGEGIEIDLAGAADPQGHCTTTSLPIPGDAFAAVTLRPPTMADKCDASEPFTPPPLTGTFARACPWTGKYDAALAGRLVCIAPDDDGSCPLGFSARFDFEQKIRDARTCTPCKCGKPAGGSCVADVLLFSDASCSTMLYSGNEIHARAPDCHRIDEDLPLAGVRVVFAQDEPGTCSPTTTVSLVDGGIERGELRTFCCSSKDLMEVIHANADN